MPTQIKICGITRADDAIAAARLGADLLGLVFVPGSVRELRLEEAMEIAAAVAGQVKLVGLFLDPARDTVEKTLRHVELQMLQFHGQETEAFCAGFGLPYLKTIGCKEMTSALPLMERYPSASALLLDGHAHGAHGGTGDVFDWRNLPTALQQDFFIAGGLTPENVATAVSVSGGACGVDVSSGVERAAGIKDLRKIESFIKEVRSVDRTRA